MGVWIETVVSGLEALELFVTPFVGVWIETPDGRLREYAYASHPSWVCGLKLLSEEGKQLITVTPFVGVWIETFCCYFEGLTCYVTPFVGVWIETCSRTHALNKAMVTPFVGVWIETYMSFGTRHAQGSHPSWVCGLKLM